MTSSVKRALVILLALTLGACRSGQQRTGRNETFAPDAGEQDAGIPSPGPNPAKILRGRITIAHEVRSFIPEGDSIEYWIIDRSGALDREYDRVTGGSKNGQPVEAELELRYTGPSDEGFAAGYEGVFEVVAIRSMERAD